MMDLYEQPARVCVVVTCPTPHRATPEETAAAIAHAVRRVAPGADVYHHTPEEKQKDAPPTAAADRIRTHTATIDRTHPARDETAYHLDLALTIYDRLASGDTTVQVSERDDAAWHLLTRAKSIVSTLPTQVAEAMVTVSEWMSTRPASDRAPATESGARYMNRHGGLYTDTGDGRLRGRDHGYWAEEPWSTVLFRMGRLTRVEWEES